VVEEEEVPENIFDIPFDCTKICLKIVLLLDFFFFKKMRYVWLCRYQNMLPVIPVGFRVLNSTFYDVSPNLEGARNNKII